MSDTPSYLDISLRTTEKEIEKSVRDTHPLERNVTIVLSMPQNMALKRLAAKMDLPPAVLMRWAMLRGIITSDEGDEFIKLYQEAVEKYTLIIEELGG